MQADDPSTWIEVIDPTVPFRQPTGVTVLAELCEVKDVRYVAARYEQWIADIDKDDVDAEGKRVAPFFNWISVFNFNPDATVLALEAMSSAQALMQLRFGHVVAFAGECRPPLVYVSFLEVAPANRSNAPDRKVHGSGPALIRIAADASYQRGYHGRVGLHSVAGAIDFYRRLGFRSLDCPNEYHELYMELDEAGAQALLKD